MVRMIYECKILSTKDPEYSQVVEWALKQYDPERAEFAEKDIELQANLKSLFILYIDNNLIGCFRHAKRKDGTTIINPLGDRLKVLKSMPKLYKGDLFIKEYNDEARATYHKMIGILDRNIIEVCCNPTERPKLSETKIRLKTREMKESDIKKLDGLANEIFGEVGEDFFIACLKTIKKYSIIAEVDGNIVGFVFGTATDGKSTANIHTLGVKEKIRREGIGEYLIRYEMQKLYDNRHIKFLANVEESNNSSMGLLTKVGFKKKRTIPVYKLSF